MSVTGRNQRLLGAGAALALLLTMTLGGASATAHGDKDGARTVVRDRNGQRVAVVALFHTSPGKVTLIRSSCQQIVSKSRHVAALTL